MSWWTNFLYWRDAAIGATGLVIGRVLPTLKPGYADLTGKIAIVTGANSGIGLATVKGIAQRGATVYLACRSKAKADAAIKDILDIDPDLEKQLVFAELDVSSFASVREFADKWKHENPSPNIDLLFHNAGVAKYDEENEFTSDGFEMTYATNFLGSFLLTYLLEEQLSPTARVIFTASFGNYTGRFTSDFSLEPVKRRTEPGFHHPYSGPVNKGLQASGSAGRYGNTKAMQTIFARLLQRRFDQQAPSPGNTSRRLAFSYSPGYTKSELLGKMNNVTFAKDGPLAALQAIASFATESEQGCATAIWLATTDDEQVTGPTNAGRYFDRMTRRIASGDLADEHLMKRLWTRWERDAGIEWQ